MLTPRLTNCTQCADITGLIADIDCKMVDMANRMYNNVTLMMNIPVSQDVMADLMHYRRILQYKYVNSDYACRFTINSIASKVKLLKFKK